MTFKSLKLYVYNNLYNIFTIYIRLVILGIFHDNAFDMRYLIPFFMIKSFEFFFIRRLFKFSVFIFGLKKKIIVNIFKKKKKLILM